MSRLSILKDFIFESLAESKKRFGKYKSSYLGLLIVNILIRLPSSHLGYASSNFFFHTSVSLILQVCLTILMVNLIITKVALDEDIIKSKLMNPTLRSIRGQLLYYASVAIGIVLLVIPAFLALFFFCLAPILEILEDHRGLSSLKRSYHLVKKDIPLFFIFSIFVFILYLLLELIFSKLGSTGLGIMLYFISAFVTTFLSIITTLSYVRIINYLKDLRVVGMTENSNLP
jgi:hypothetical protein